MIYNKAASTEMFISGSEKGRKSSHFAHAKSITKAFVALWSKIYNKTIDLVRICDVSAARKGGKNERKTAVAVLHLSTHALYYDSTDALILCFKIPLAVY